MLLTSTACLPRSAAARTIDLTSPGNTVNGKTADIAITTHGSDFFFAICAAMCVGLAYRKERRDRLFHYMTAAVVFVAAIAYCKQCQQPSD
jgi:bacteriorhodopsin